MRVSRSGPEHVSPTLTPCSDPDMIEAGISDILRPDGGDGSRLGGWVIAVRMYKTWSWNPSFTISFAAASNPLNTGSRSSASLRKLLNSELFISRSLKRDRSAREEETLYCPRQMLGLMVLHLPAVGHFVRHKQQDPSPKSIDEFEPRSPRLLPVIYPCGVFFLREEWGIVVSPHCPSVKACSEHGATM